MTQIKARYGRDGYSIVSLGHAGTKESCVAVSTIIQTLAGWIENAHSGACLLNKGDAKIAFPKGGGADVAMDMAVIGLLQVQKAAPDDVKVEIICEE